uniref:Malonyl-CoA:ACP transacylase (MAT) domain-containing protein n=1 Tax=Timema cristinae TaxID=61476 RepID=A0A7R9CNV7_TIMCR|nr:unnamed protein product [Timema cristinae]
MAPRIVVLLACPMDQSFKDVNVTEQLRDKSREQRNSSEHIRGKTVPNHCTAVSAKPWQDSSKPLNSGKRKAVARQFQTTEQRVSGTNENKVMTEKTKWDGGLVALNSIGSTGSYAHTLLRSYTKDKPQDNNPKDGVPRIVCVSGRTEEGITKVIDKHELIMKYLKYLEQVWGMGCLGVIDHVLIQGSCFGGLCRSGGCIPSRGIADDQDQPIVRVEGYKEGVSATQVSWWAVGSSPGNLKSMPVDIEFIRLLHDIHSSNIINHNYRGYILLPTGETTYTEWKHFNGSFRPLWFVFSGMGSQWVGMGQHLMKLPVLAATLEKCHNILVPFGIDLLHILTTDDSTIFNNILHSFVGIASIQMALVELLRLLNIVPDGLIGHSVGELGCAYADGCFSAEQMILAAYYRGMASLETELINGSMAAVGLSSHKVKDLCPPGIDVACHNSGESSTISGPTEEINTFVAELKEKGIFAKAVNVSNIAYHSRYIKPAAPKLLEYLKKIIPYPKPRSSKWFSTSVPESDWDSTLAKFSSAEYHTNNLLSSVLFEETSKHIPKHAITIEIAPHGLLQAILRRSLGPDCINISLTQRGNQHGLEFLLNAVGKMYLHGICPRVHELYPVVKYPVSRGTPSIGSLVSWDHTDTWHTASQVDMTRMVFWYERHILSYLEGYRRPWRVLWRFGCLSEAWGNLCFGKLWRVVYNIADCIESLGFTLSIQKGTGDFEIFENKRPLVTGQIRIPENAAAEFSKNISVPSEDSTNLTGEDVYSELKHRGYHYSGQFKGILNAQIGHEGSTSVIEWSNDWLLFLDSLIQLAILHKGEDSQQMQLPVSFQKVIIDPLRHPEKREQKAIYQKFSNILTCGGVEIRGIELFKLTTENYNSIKLDTFRFLSHSNPQLKLLIENHAMILYDKIEIVEIISKDVTCSLGPRVNSIFKSYPRVKFQLNTVFSENILQLNKDKQISLILANKDTAMQAASITNGAFLLARFETSQELNFGQELVVIIQQQFEDGYWVLLKKVVPVNDRSSVIHLSTEALVSPGQLRSSLNVGKDNGTKVYVVAQNQNIQDVENFVTHIYKNLKSEYARYVFVLDQSSTTFSPTGRLFRDQLSQDLTVNVYFNGSWGSLRHLPLPQSAAPKPSTLQKLRPYLSLKDWDLSFISLNYEDWCLNRSRTELPPDIGVVDLSGWSPEGKRVMALAHKKDPNIHFKTNLQLIWSIPDSWSLEDAATVPLPYAMKKIAREAKKDKEKQITERVQLRGGEWKKLKEEE